MMRSSGTPCSKITSTALIAEPPVAVTYILTLAPTLRDNPKARTKHGVQEQHVTLRDVWRELRMKQVSS